MDVSEFIIASFFIIAIIVIPSSIVIHEMNETPLDKCLDNCVTERLLGELRLECNVICVDKFAFCVKDVGGKE